MLSKKDYEEAIESLIEKGYVVKTDNKIILTDVGQNRAIEIMGSLTPESFVLTMSYLIGYVQKQAIVQSAKQ